MDNVSLDNKTPIPDHSRLSSPLSTSEIPEHIRTARLWLRPLDASDTPAVFKECCSDPCVARYMDWPTHQGLSETAEFIQSIPAARAANTACNWGIALRDSNRLVGMLSCYLHERAASIGYLLSHSNRGKGYATEAAGALIDILHALNGLDGILATCHTENAASMRVLDRLGFTQGGLLRDAAVFPNLDSKPANVYWYWQAARRVSAAIADHSESHELSR